MGLGGLKEWFSAVSLYLWRYTQSMPDNSPQLLKQDWPFPHWIIDLPPKNSAIENWSSLVT